MTSINDHIKKDKEILDNPVTSPQARRHTQEELQAQPHLNFTVMQTQMH